jgi:hypothetical protein
VRTSQIERSNIPALRVIVTAMCCLQARSANHNVTHVTGSRFLAQSL